MKFKVRAGYVWIDARTGTPHPEVREVTDATPGLAGQMYKLEPVEPIEPGNAEANESTTINASAARMTASPENRGITTSPHHRKHAGKGK